MVMERPEEIEEEHGDDVVFYFRLSKSLRRRIKKRAIDEDKSMTQWLTDLSEKALGDETLGQS